MADSTQKSIRNVGLFAGVRPTPAPAPGIGGNYKYTGKQYEYFEQPTTAFIFENSQYASNYYEAQVQGIMPGDFETERGAYIRSMDVVEQTTGTKMPNDYQAIYFQDTRIKGLFTGAKVKFAGNTWLAISPFNISDPLASSVIRRCNAIWKHLDYYGNVLCEPFIFHEGRAHATASDYSDYGVLPRWYQRCAMQLNEQTKELAYNRRIVLGSSVIEVRGLVDFITDFSGQNNEESGNAEPAHVMFFDAQYQEPTEIDDMERGIAGGKAFSWVITPSFSDNMGVNGTQKITATSLRNGEAPDTENHPISYTYFSMNPSVLTVSASGTVTAVSEGTASVKVALAQNPDIYAFAEITVTNELPQAEFVFTPELPTRMKQMQTYTGTVAVMQGGAEIETPITMAAYGATEAADAVFNSADNTLSITAYEPSQTPLSLVFRAEEQNLTYTANIRLEGF